jgi:hypothetical protein
VQLPIYTIYLDDEAGDTTEHHLAIRNGDRLRAELEAPRHVPPALSSKASAFHTMTLWCWAAAVREGIFTGKFTEFATACAHIEPPRKDDDADEASVPPTQPDQPTDRP